MRIKRVDRLVKRNAAISESNATRLLQAILRKYSLCRLDGDEANATPLIMRQIPRAIRSITNESKISAHTIIGRVREYVFRQAQVTR